MRSFKKCFVAFGFILMSASCVENELLLNKNNENLGPDDGLDVSEGLAALPTIPDMTEYRNIAAASISRNLGISDTYMLKFRYRLTTEYFYHNYERQIRDEAIRINAYFGFQNFDFKQYSHFEINNPAYSGTPTLPSHVAGTGDIYNSEQLRILDAYFYEMYNFKTANDLSLYYAYGQQMVRDSPLSMEEKYVVLACIESGNEFGKKYLSGAWSGVRIDVGATLNEPTSGCSMNWKQVWQGAVIGGFIGAGRGVWIGAAGGTVALPGFGTVSGAVGGAVFGFVGGFAGGAGAGIVQQLLFDCLLKLQTTQPDLQCYDIDYLLNHEDCVQEIIDNKVWAKITG